MACNAKNFCIPVLGMSGQEPREYETPDSTCGETVRDVGEGDGNVAEKTTTRKHRGGTLFLRKLLSRRMLSLEVFSTLGGLKKLFSRNVCSERLSTRNFVTSGNTKQ